MYADQTGTNDDPKLEVIFVSSEVSGITKDNEGAVLPNCEVALFEVLTVGPPSTYLFVESQISDGSGAYTFNAAIGKEYFVYAIKDGSPNVFDSTDNTIQGVIP